MDLTDVSRHQRRRSAFLNVQDHHLADNLPEIFGTALFRSAGCYHFASSLTAGLAAGLVRELSAAICVALESLVACADGFAPVTQHRIAFAEPTKDRQIIAGLHIVLGAEVNVDDKLLGDQLS